MDPLSTISSATLSLKTAIEIAQLLKATDTSVKEAEMKLKVADLLDALANTKIDLSELKEAIIEKDNRIKELLILIEDKKEMLYENLIYVTKDDNGMITGCYCPHCFDADKIKIRITQKNNGFYCMHCKSFYSKFDINRLVIGRATGI